MEITVTSFYDPYFANAPANTDTPRMFKDVNPPKDEIKGYEFQHAHYALARDEQSDLIYIKEYVHLHNGERLINYRSLVDFERPYWLTRKECRTHNDKLEYASLDTLDEFHIPQFMLEKDLAWRLRYNGRQLDLRSLCASNWVYGATIDPVSFIRHRYKKKNPDCVTPVSSVAWIDSETDVVNGTNETIIVQASFRGRAIVAVVESWLNGMANVPELFYQKLHEMMGTTIKKRNCNVELYFAKDALDAIATVVDRIMSWETDYVEVWNINYDIGKFLEVLVKENVHPRDIFCHPGVPERYRRFEYIPGRAEHISKKGTKIKFSEKQRWHVLDTPGPQWIDGMQYYYYRRRHEGQISCGLDACLRRHTDLGKIEYDCGASEGTIDWHRIMQEKHKIVYLVYAAADCIHGEVLDEKIQDVRLHFKTDIGDTIFKTFTSLPKQYNDTFHHHIYDNDRFAMGTASNTLGNEFDDILINEYDWIITLPTHNMEPSGIPVIKELPHLKSQCYIHSADADVVRTYPMVNVNLNVSRRTTYKEPTVKISGMTETQRRHWGINLTGANVNAVDLATKGLGLPHPDEWRAMSRKEKNQHKV